MCRISTPRPGTDAALRGQSVQRTGIATRYLAPHARTAAVTIAALTLGLPILTGGTTGRAETPSNQPAAEVRCFPEDADQPNKPQKQAILNPWTAHSEIGWPAAEREEPANESPLPETGSERVPAVATVQNESVLGLRDAIRSGDVIHQSSRTAIAMQSDPTPRLLPLPDVAEEYDEAPWIPPERSVADGAKGVLPVGGGPTFWAPGSSCPVCGVTCRGCPVDQRPTWKHATAIPWEVFAQGEYVGPHRRPHVPEYRLRVDDLLNFTFRLTAEASVAPYEFNVGDRLRVESLAQPEVARDVIIQPDGNITVFLIGQIRAAGRTIEAVRAELEERYKPFIKEPAISVTPLEMNTRLTELRNAVDSRFGAGGQSVQVRVTPEGTIQLPGIGSVLVQGLNLDEVRQELNLRYGALVAGLDITPDLVARAPRHVYVLGEVFQPGRIELSGPTTLMQAIAMAGSWKVGAGLRQIVVMRRDENWELMATRVNLRKALYGKDPCPEGEFWLRDSDIVLIPKGILLTGNELIEQVFSRGIYSVFPVSYSYQLRNLSTIN